MGKKFIDNPTNGAELRLIDLGYKQELQRGLSVPGNVIMGLANVSPVMAAFTYALAAFATVGTATAGGTLLQCINVLCIGLILGELGSIYPVSGGLYSITSYVLPKPLVFLGVFNFMIQAFIYIPAIAMGVGAYMQILFPQLPQGTLACSIISASSIILALLIGLNSIILNNRVTTVFLIVQLIIVFVFLYVCFANPARSLGDVVLNPQIIGASGELEPASMITILTGMGIMCAAIDGYGASLGFSEETKGSCKGVGKAVFCTALLTLLLVGACDVFSMVAAPDLKEFLTADSPLLYVIQSYMGPVWTTLLNVGIIIASFGCNIVLINYMARVLWTGGRDRLWPDAINRQLCKVSGKSQVPYVGLLVIAVVDCVLVFASDIVTMITFGGMSAAVVYLLIAIGSIRSRIVDKDITRPFKMPLFPIPSILVICFLCIAIGSQTPSDLMIVGIILVIAMLYYLLYYRPREKREAREGENKEA
ncbi:MAG: APC family permease [Bacillota bacterium]|nr:APC family permease [Bacillota bacterium]